ncbi:hypothetical protein JNW88_01750 [Micromonospora sp. ATA32]|nr:hypothetical protein [Micromonospora sp. ATA32]
MYAAEYVRDRAFAGTSGSNASLIELTGVELLARPQTKITDVALTSQDLDTEGSRPPAINASIIARRSTHRLQAAHDADRAVVMHDGRIIELGTHDDVVASDGAYAVLWHTWQGEENRSAEQDSPVDIGSSSIGLSQGGDSMFTPDQLGLDDPAEYVAAERRYAHAASQRRAARDSGGEGRTLLAVAWAVEKQGRGPEALEYAQTARLLLRDAGDLKFFAECCHSIGVWRFHHFDSDPPVEDFRQAVEARLAIPDLMAAAQSWHNLGFVQLVAGRPVDAAFAYERATDLLDEVRGGSETSSAFRQLGFVYSHQAYAAARYGLAADALRATTKYFEHVKQTGAHREPVYAYLAPGIALAAAPEIPEEEASALEALADIQPDAETWLRVALGKASDAMTSHVETGTGRHAYLGAHLLALVELARWCYAADHRDEADQLMAQALSLARARGWHGEASRIDRRRER